MASETFRVSFWSRFCISEDVSLAGASADELAGGKPSDLSLFRMRTCSTMSSLFVLVRLDQHSNAAAIDPYELNLDGEDDFCDSHLVLQLLLLLSASGH